MDRKKSKIAATFLILLVTLQINVFAQENEETKTLLNDGKSINIKSLGFFIAPAYGISQIDGSTTSFLNIRGGLNIKDKFFLGAYVNTSITEIKPQSEIIPNIYMDYWSIGGFVEYTLFPKKVMHLTFPLHFGYGEVQMDNNNGGVNFGEENFFTIEPAALLEVNLNRYIRFNLGAGYRFVERMNYRNLNGRDLSNLTGYAGLKIGVFK